MTTEKDRTDAAEANMEDKFPEDVDRRMPPAKGEVQLDTTESQVDPAAEKNIHVALSDVMRDIGPIAKSERNTSQGFNYRGIDAICNAAYPLFVEHGVTLSAKIVGDVQRSERKTAKGGTLYYSVFIVRYTFWARDGSHRETEAVGEGMDSGDKSSNKAMSVAMKYAILQMLCIPVAMKDADEPYDAPAQAKGAPTVPPRDETPKSREPAATPTVGRETITALASTWRDRADQRPYDDPDEKVAGEKARVGFAEFVAKATGREFTVEMVFRPGYWVEDDLQKVEEAMP